MGWNHFKISNREVNYKCIFCWYCFVEKDVDQRRIKYYRNKLKIVTEPGILQKHLIWQWTENIMSRFQYICRVLTNYAKCRQYINLTWNKELKTNCTMNISEETTCIQFTTSTSQWYVQTLKQMIMKKP